MNKADEIIDALNLFPHPEGGYFKETYRSVGEINVDSLSIDYKGKRNYSTSIYFLLKSENISAFHKIKQDEIWHFYDGSPIIIHEITEGGRYQQTIVGIDIAEGQLPQYVVEGGNWFAASVVRENDFSFVGCTVSPGFDFGDFELPSREVLIDKFPQHKDIITRLTN